MGYLRIPIRNDFVHMFTGSPLLTRAFEQTVKFLWNVLEYVHFILQLFNLL